MNRKDKKILIKEIDLLLMEYYLFPNVAKEIVGLLNNTLDKGGYDNITDPIKFSIEITKNLQSINNDLHLKLKFDPDDKIGKLKPELKNRIELSRTNNFGFEEVKVMKGNIGYLKLNKFENPIFSGDTLTAAMDFLGNTDAMIIDITSNPGGNIPMGELLASYFFNDRIHLSSFEYREYDITHHTYTAPYVSGKQFLKKDLYILISKGSASAAESFAYDLKHLKRATIIGEQSIGAAHSGSYRAIKDFKLYVPSGRPLNPNTNSNWEGIGVTPHINVSKKDSIATAHLLALKNIQVKNKNASYEKAIQSIKLEKTITKSIDNWLKENSSNVNYT